MSASPLALGAKKVIDATWLHGDAYDLSSQAAFALESAQLLQSPETAAELERLRARVAELEAERHSTNEALDDAVQALRLLNTQRGDVEQLIERERAEDEECVDIDALESALGLCSDGDPSQAPHDDEEGCDHPNGYGPNGCAGCGAFRPADGEDDVRPQVRKLRALLAGQRAQAGGAS